MNFLLMTYLTHLLVDFIFQSDATVKTKAEEFSWIKIKCLFGHAIISNLVIGNIVYLLVWTGEFLLYNNDKHALSWCTYFLLLFYVSVCHFALDLFKSTCDTLLEKKWFDHQHEVVTYTLDQVLHILSIYLAMWLVRGPNAWSQSYEQLTGLLNHGDIIALVQFGLVFLILETKFSEYFVGKFLKGTGVSLPASDNSNTEKAQKYHLGSYIGNLERIMIAIFFFSNNIPSISIVVAIKAVTRFKDIETQSDFAEYYLIGSILSLLLGCLFPLLAQQLFQ